MALAHAAGNPFNEISLSTPSILSRAVRPDVNFFISSPFIGTVSQSPGLSRVAMYFAFDPFTEYEELSKSHSGQNSSTPRFTIVYSFMVLLPMILKPIT